MSRRNGKYKNCTECGKKYYIRADRAEASKWCSQACWSKRNPESIKVCEACGDEYKTYQRDSRFCSHDCYSVWLSENNNGENHPNWKGGVSLTNERARNSTELRKWREKVYKRDNYTCQHCGDTGHLHAHHIEEWAENKDKRFDVDNGLTLCIDCHGKVHGKDFTERAKNYCPDCGKQIKRESKRCRSCSTKNQWKKRRVAS